MKIDLQAIRPIQWVALTVFALGKMTGLAAMVCTMAHVLDVAFPLIILYASLIAIAVTIAIVDWRRDIKQSKLQPT